MGCDLICLEFHHRAEWYNAIIKIVSIIRYECAVVGKKILAGGSGCSGILHLDFGAYREMVCL